MGVLRAAALHLADHFGLLSTTTCLRCFGQQQHMQNKQTATLRL
jgi:hypothetical protein